MKFLIVDDEEITRRFLGEYVRPFGPYMLASDGSEAFSLFCSAYDAGQPFDLIFLDLLLPELGGLEVLGMIRDFEKRSACRKEQRARVIIVSGKDDGESIYEAHINECSDYLVKPVDRADLNRVLLKLGVLQEVVQ